MFALPFSSRSLTDALALGPALARHTALDRAPALVAVTLVDARRSVVLGAHQRVGAVVDFDASLREEIQLFRRATSGNAAFVDGPCLVVTLALAHLAALAPDATPPTLLNRSVRGVLRGLNRLGARATYGGRDTIALARAPGVWLGFEQYPDGRALLECLLPLEVSLGLPERVASDDERARARRRLRGVASTALRACVGPEKMAQPSAIAEAIVEGIATQAHVPREDFGEVTSLAPFDVARTRCNSAHDPLDAVPTVRAEIEIPAGLLEASRDLDGRLTLTGDLLAPTYLLRAFEHAAHARVDTVDEAMVASAALEGARPGDLWEALCAVRDDDAST